MAFGLEIYDANGLPVLDANNRLSRIIGTSQHVASDGTTGSPIVTGNYYISSVGLSEFNFPRAGAMLRPLNPNAYFGNVGMTYVYYENYAPWVNFETQQGQFVEVVYTSDIRPNERPSGQGVQIVDTQGNLILNKDDRLLIIDHAGVFYNPSTVGNGHVYYLGSVQIPQTPPGAVRYFNIPPVPDNMEVYQGIPLNNEYWGYMCARISPTVPNQLDFFSNNPTSSPLPGVTTGIPPLPFTYYTGYAYL